MVFGVGGSNGATSDWTKSMMADGRHLGKFGTALCPIHFVFGFGVWSDLENG